MNGILYNFMTKVLKGPAVIGWRSNTFLSGDLMKIFGNVFTNFLSSITNNSDRLRMYN